MINKPFETYSSDRLVERSALEFENFVAKQHSAVASRSPVNIPWAPYEQVVTAAYIPAVMRGARRAYEARAMFAMENPDWAPLPLGDECYPFLRATGGMYVLGHYAFSLQLLSYDYVGHPRFYNFACGVLAHPSAPEHVRNDIELQIEFPAEELPGLCGRMIWFGGSLQAGERLTALGRMSM
jgi:hypothetical protein